MLYPAIHHTLAVLPGRIRCRTVWLYGSAPHVAHSEHQPARSCPGGPPARCNPGHCPGLAGTHDLDDYPEGQPIPGLVVYRYDAPLFFANAEDFRRRALSAAERGPGLLRRRPRPGHVRVVSPQRGLAVTGARRAAGIDRQCHQADPRATENYLGILGVIRCRRDLERSGDEPQPPSADGVAALTGGIGDGIGGGMYPRRRRDSGRLARPTVRSDSPPAATAATSARTMCPRIAKAHLKSARDGVQTRSEWRYCSGPAIS